MRVFVYSPQFEISTLLSEQLSDSKTRCIPFHRIGDLVDTVRNSIIPPNLIVLDYLSVNHELFNSISHSTKSRLFIPFVFFNDPCLTKDTRVEHWKNIIHQIKNVPDDISNLETFLLSLQELVESEEFRPYLPLMTPPLKLPDRYIKNVETLYYLKENSTDCIEDFKARNNVPGNLFYLLSILQKFREKALSYEEIKMKYLEDNKNISIESLKVLMSKLRNMIRNDKKCNFLINRSNKTYRFVFYKL